MPQNIPNRFHPLIARWFADRLGTPTEVQLRAWGEVIAGKHLLVTAPTGSGKTLAAFLWAINQLVSGAWPRGETRVLYISPLKALNNDVRKNLITPLQELAACFREAGEEFPQIGVETRSGDTPGSERQRMLRHPPEILITTPESLNILLTSKSGRQILTGITTVILDEIHAVAGTKRGTHLITAVDRLVPLCGEFQRIALSATVRPLEMVADFVGGFIREGDHYRKRPVSIVRADQAKEFRIEVRAPEEVPGEPAEEFWPRLAREFKRIIAEHRSTLFFANSRRTTERVTRLINEDEPEDLAYAHHGSLSKEIRLAVEEKLKRGELKAIVATNSLELGIDIGRLDSVVLIQSPRAISSAIQRIGRSGHGVGEVSRGLLYPSHGMDFAAAAVIARAIAEHDTEALRPVESPLDLLAQIVLSMALSETWDLDELYAFLKTSYPYRELARKHFDLVVAMLEGRYADSRVPELKPRATVDRLANTIAAREGTALLIYLEGGTIPDRGYFDLRLKETNAKIGELDEEFVWERRLGDTFSLGAQVWQIVAITHNAVEVVPARRAQQIIPFWRAEELDRDFHFSERIASFLEFCNSDVEKDSFLPELRARYAMIDAAAAALAAFLRRQKEASGAELPHRHHLLVEHFHDPQGGAEAEQVILHTLWGNSVNRPFTFALAAAWEARFGYPLQAFYNNDAIALLLPHDVEARHLFALVTPENIETLLTATLERTGWFGARFRENAGRALLLPKMGFRKRMPLWLTRLRAKKLLGAIARYRDFPVLIETWRSCLKDEFDLETLKRLLAEVREGEIRLSEARTTVASPMALGLIWQQTNKYVYADDTPEGGKASALGHDLIRELAVSPHLRPRLPAGLVRFFEEKRQRTAPGYAPETGRELIDWVKERLLIPADEWSRLIAAVTHDQGIDAGELTAEVAERIVRIGLPGAAFPLVGAIEMLPEIARGLGQERRELVIEPITGDAGLLETVERLVERIFAGKLHDDDVEGEAAAADEEEASSASFLGQWLSFYGPMTVGRAETLLSLPKGMLAETLRTLEEAGQVVVDQFTEGAQEPEVCDAVNLEALLRILRRSRQPSFEPLAVGYLPLFLAAFQGLTGQGRSLDDLRTRLEQLFGYPLPAGAWEEEVLPARLEPCSTAWLDSLMQTSGLSWFGCGDRRLSFAFPEELDLFRERGDAREPATAWGELFPDPNGRYGFPAIRSLSGKPAADVARELWRLAWGGAVSNDSFVAIRKGILNRFRPPAEEQGRVRRSLAGRWQAGGRSAGNWYLLPAEVSPLDPLEREETNKERVRVLLERYGIIFRELLLRELPPLQWQRLFRTLRIMELSGELLSGSFFHGIPGLQFVSHEGFRMLARGLSEDAVFWLNAVDPASLCGVGLEGVKDELPPRIPWTHLVYHGTRLVVVSRRFGKELRIDVPPDDSHLPEYLAFFRVLVSREFNPRKRIIVERINGAPAGQSAYREALINFGFQGAYRGLEFWRGY